MIAEEWFSTDIRDYGRCFTLRPSIDKINSGIKEITLAFNADVKVYFHNHGTMISFSRRNPSIDVPFGVKKEVAVEHQVYKMLSSKEKKCNDNSDYELDDCVLSGVNKVLLANFHKKTVLIFMKILLFF